MPTLESHLGTFKSNISGAGFTFGVNIVNRFLFTSNMQKIYRAHQLCMDGYLQLFDGKVTTIWSAPNYCYKCGNKASILELDQTEYFNVFDAAPKTERPIPAKSPPEYFL